MALELVWDHLRRVRSLSFVARSGVEAGWNGRGSGSVVVEESADRMLTFSESGLWRPEVGPVTRFHNVFRWSVIGATLRLEHLRLGANRPVHLFDLAQSRERQWNPVSSHLCNADCYSAELRVCEDHLDLSWSINGPRKQETLEYTYSWQEASS
jgi:hypothetical protein